MSTPKRKTHTLTANFTKQGAEKIHKTFLQLVEHDGELYLNASKVSLIDAAGLQLIYALVRDRKLTGKKTTLAKCPPIVTSTIETFGLSAELSVA